MADCLSYLYSALDISAELMARYTRLISGTQITVSAFDPETAVGNALRIRREWEKNNKYPVKIQEVRDYRNLMLHGQIVACEVTAAAQFLIVPALGMERYYLDWRPIVSGNQKDKQDFSYSTHLVEAAFEEVLSF